MSPAPDWYDDVEHPGYLRFWDGAAWTEHRSPKPAGSSSLPGSAAELSQAAPQQLPDASIGFDVLFAAAKLSSVLASAKCFVS